MNKTYLPYVTNTATLDGQGDLSSNTEILFELMMHDPMQQRPVCQWDERIAAIAQARADMQLDDGAIFIHHLDKQGHGPNWWLRQAGIVLPDWYDKDDEANNVESIGLNFLTANECWQAWLLSSTHKAHVLGYSPTFISQTRIGIGYAKGKELYPTFWVLISCPS